MDLPAALQLTGSTTLLPRMQRVAEAYMRQHDVRIVINGGCGTGRGYKALLDGTADIAMASGAAPAELADLAKARGLAFRETVVTRDAILALVHASNRLHTLTLLQLRNIFTGRVDNWSALAGPDQPIEVLVGLPTGGVSSSWRRRLLGDDDSFTPRARVLGTDERLAWLASHPWSISYAPESALPLRGLKPLRVDGKPFDPTPPDYPLRAPMMLVTLGPPAPLAAGFIAHAAGTAAQPDARGHHE